MPNPLTPGRSSMSEVYFANQEVAEAASRSLIDLVGVVVEDSKPSCVENTSAPSP